MRYPTTSKELSKFIQNEIRKHERGQEKTERRKSYIVRHLTPEQVRRNNLKETIEEVQGLLPPWWKE